MSAKAPLEGDRISREPLLPDFLAPLERRFFQTPRWHVKVYVGEVLAYEVGWISAPDAETAIAHVRGAGFTDAARLEAEEVKE